MGSGNDAYAGIFLLSELFFGPSDPRRRLERAQKSGIKLMNYGLIGLPVLFMLINYAVERSELFTLKINNFQLYPIKFNYGWTTASILLFYGVNRFISYRYYKKKFAELK